MQRTFNTRRFKMWLAEHEMTLKECCRRHELSYQHMSQAMAGRHIGPEMLCRLIEITGLSFRELVDSKGIQEA